MHPLDILLQIVGCFYTFAGFVLARSVLSSRLLDQALEAITLQKTQRAETFKEAYALLLALAIFASGIALLGLSWLAIFLFAAGSALQALYIFWLAPRFLDRHEEADAPGRRQSSNAFLVYAVMTLVVAGAAQAGRLHAWSDLPDRTRLLMAGAVLSFAVYIAWQHVRLRLHPPRGKR